MNEYTAPLKDMRFVMNAIADLPSIRRLPGYEDSGEDVTDAILDEAAKLASGALAPLNMSGDEKGAWVENRAVVESPGFSEAYRQFVDGGWNALPCNPEYGGMGLPEVVAAGVMEMWLAANSSFALCPVLTQGAINAIESHANASLREIYLAKMVAGEWTGTMNLTEPQAGSDLAAVRTRAVREGDHYRICGTKIFITWGDHGMTDNIVHLVLARTPDAPEGVKGISLFVVPKFLVNEDGSLGERNDVYPVSVEHKMGIHASPTCVMSYGDNTFGNGGGAIGYLVGEENQGLVYMFTMMNHARLNMGIQGVALADRAYQQAVAYAKTRVQGKAAGDRDKGAIIRHADVRRMLLLMRAQTEAARAICYLTAAQTDIAHRAEDDATRARAQARVDLLTPIAKGWSTEIAQEVTSLGVQVHGGMGFIEETGAAQHMRDARISTIYEGTTGIQANDLIGRKTLRDSGREMAALIGEMRGSAALLRGELGKLGEAVELAIDTLQTATDWVLKHGEDQPQQAGSASFNFLMLAGTVVGGWLLALSAQRAQQDGGDQDFARAKQLTARFYAEQLLPRSQAYAAAAMAGCDTVMSMDDALF